MIYLIVFILSRCSKQLAPVFVFVVNLLAPTLFLIGAKFDCSNSLS